MKNLSLTHPHFSKLPSPEFLHHLQRVSGNLPLILSPWLLGGSYLTGGVETLTQAVWCPCVHTSDRIFTGVLKLFTFFSTFLRAHLHILFAYLFVCLFLCVLTLTAVLQICPSYLVVEKETIAPLTGNALSITKV